MMLSKKTLGGMAVAVATLTAALPATAQVFTTDKPAYLLYADNGTPSSFSNMVDDLARHDVIFIGEYHNSSVTHWLEHVIFKAVADKLDNKVTLGMEMFEADTQLKVNEYMSGLIVEERFLAETYLWENYKTDYAPIVESAKERGIRLISTNVPRRYARIISSDGIDALKKFPAESQQYFGEVLSRVEAIRTPDSFFAEPSTMMTMGAKPGGMGDAAKSRPTLTDEQKKKAEEKMIRLTQAQALKDAVMANNIAKHLEYPFIHINGNYHSDNGKGIITYLKEKHPALKIATVTTVYQDDLSSLDKEYREKADYYIVLPADTHKTY